MVFEVRDLWPELPIAMGALKSPITKWLATKLEKWAYDNSSYIVGLSPGMCEGVLKTGYPKKRIVCVPNSCDLELFGVSRREGIEFREQRKWLGERPLIVYAGTIGHINDVGYLIDVAKFFLDRGHEARFIIVGEGVNQSKFEEYALDIGVLNKNTFFEAAISKQNMPALLSAATICTSLFIPVKEMWNNSANKFFDALAAGRPVAINYGGWQSEILRKHGAGIEMKPGAPAEGAQALMTFLASSECVEAAGYAAKALAVGEFSRAVLADRLIHTLEIACDEKNI